jgi:hypothetical protein
MPPIPHLLPVAAARLSRRRAMVCARAGALSAEPSRDDRATGAPLRRRRGRLRRRPWPSGH